MKDDKLTLVETLRSRLIVSCQAYRGEPLKDSAAMTLVAQSVLIGGAAAVRVEGLNDIRMVASQTDSPVIGIIKTDADSVFITPTVHDALAVAEAGARIIALDGTRRARPDGRTLAQTIREIHLNTDALVMADTGSVADGLAAEEAGADIVGTTLAGYTGERPRTVGPDLDLIHDLSTQLHVPVFAEGRIHTPEQGALAFEAGAYAIVVGTAITHPTTITKWFVDAIHRSNADH